MYSGPWVGAFFLVVLCHHSFIAVIDVALPDFDHQKKLKNGPLQEVKDEHKKTAEGKPE